YLCVMSRLYMKLKLFVESELPLLLSKGYLTHCRIPQYYRKLQDMGDSLVRIPCRLAINNRLIILI
ncbi:MAG: hypothetical protein ACJ701_09445, partial [Nitrososphaera sp.]